MALDETAGRASLAAWVQAGITLVRDVGSSGGLTSELRAGPAVQAAGRFLARQAATSRTCSTRRCLISAALAEIGHGAAWVKVIADFPDPAAGTDAGATCQAGAIARVVAAAHHVGARVAVHSTVPGPGQLVAASLDSIEHGWSGLDEHVG